MSSTERSLAIVADVHGEACALSAALAHYQGQRHVVLVGDYVNRGPDPAAVLEILAEAMDQGGVTALMGNHDYAFLEYIKSGELGPFARMGGLATLHSYVGAVDNPHKALLDTMPARHIEILNDLQSCYEDDDLLVSHCGVPPHDPSSRRLADLVLGSHPELFSDKASALPKSVVSGHYVQRSRVPFVSDRYTCIDAGCGTSPGAPLVVLELPEREFRYFEVR
ncbi:metallophosphoesterase [Mycobacteroides abscessus]|uniref:metallophosphoesterase n=1 Tax=Mycobacteroides abscessus TaxID=36809 RepID=UPI000C266917|nr:metallophosphoesterase [Mycobacteroides abscessus]